MRVAVSCSDGRISPVFDWAKAMVVVDQDGTVETGRQHKSLEGIQPLHRPGELSRLNIEVLLCGGISARIAEAFAAKGIRVVAGLTGDIDEVLSAFANGRLPDPAFSMPGWRFDPSSEEEPQRDPGAGPHRRGQKP